MSEIFNKPSHLNRIKVMMGLRVYQGHSNANAYIAEQKLRKIVKQRIDDELWLSFKQRRAMLMQVSMSFWVIKTFVFTL